jgi:large subunit ribosomal protein L24
MKVSLHIGDEVEVIAGDGRGMCGKICRILDGGNYFQVAGVRLRKVCMKKSAKHPDGAVLEMETPIHRSNLRKTLEKMDAKIC